jgi:uncharacterized protein (DUF305 family)
MKAFIASTLFLALAACSGQSHNQADANFAQQMIPHHQQAVEMSQMAEESAGPEVRKLAARIKAAQAPEIAQMQGWLAAWNLPVMADHGMSHDVPGMMSDADMRKLRLAEGKTYDRLWLQMMIEHHQGAIAMAETEIDDGKYPDAIRLAKAIVKAQEAEIVEMRGMLK